MIVTVLLRTADAIAGLGLALPDTLLLIGVAQTKSIMLEHADRHANRRCTAVQYVGTGHDLRQMLTYRVADFLVVPQPVASASGE